MSKINQNNNVPILRGEELYIPFVGAIITRKEGEEEEVLIQLRHKSSDSKYVDVIEIPGGKFRAFEDIYTTLKREVLEESGLKIEFIQDSDKRIKATNRDDSSDIIYPFCVTQMQQGPFIGLIFLCRASGTLLKKSDETKEIHWIKKNELRDIVKDKPQQIYTAFLAPLKLYLDLV